MWVIVYRAPQAARAALAHAYLWDRRETSRVNPSSPESFVNRRIRVPRPPRAAFRHQYLNVHDTSRVNPSSPESWTNRRTTVPRGLRAAVRHLYRNSHDTSQDTPNTPLAWRAQRLRLPPLPPAIRQLYFLPAGDTPDTGGDVPAPEWRARHVGMTQRRASSMYLFNGSADGGATPPPSVAGTALWLRRRRRQQFLGRGKHGG